MPRNLKTTICTLALAAFATLALSLQSAAAEPAAKAEGLWVSDLSNVSEFQGTSLQASGAPSPNLSFGLKREFDQFSIAFDRPGDLWVTAHPANSHDFPIIKVTRAEIASLKSGKQVRGEYVTPGKGLAETAWFGIAFDAAGNLWITNPGLQALMEFPARQIKTGHIGSPVILISAMNFSPGEIRFDASDNLWVTAGNNQLWRFAPSDRAASGPPNPGLIVNLPNGIGVVDFAFDSSGNLWLAGPVFSGPVFVDELEMISAGDLAGTGEVSPPAAVTVTSSAFPVQSAGLSAGTCFGGIDFDHLGDLWVSAHCVADALVIEFTPGQLSMGGDLEPSLALGQNAAKTNLIFPGPMRFGPPLK
jgi:hypothetical protein